MTKSMKPIGLASQLCENVPITSGRFPSTCTKYEKNTDLERVAIGSWEVLKISFRRFHLFPLIWNALIEWTRNKDHPGESQIPCARDCPQHLSPLSWPWFPQGSLSQMGRHMSFSSAAQSTCLEWHRSGIARSSQEQVVQGRTWRKIVQYKLFL